MPAFRESRVSALLEVAMVVIVGILAHGWLRSLEMGVGITSLGTVAMFALATWLLRRRGIHWRDLGLRRPENLGQAVRWGLGLFLVDMLLLPITVDTVSNALGLPPQQLGAFAALKGNTFEYLVLLLPVAWGIAAFGEELLYRGFIYHRLTDALGRRGWATAVALLAQAVLFALGHAYLGPRGMLNAGTLGLVASLAYLRNGRNLWPLIIAHGLVDTVGITTLYLGVAHH
jgi:membrane protease YdiL (CAAX protease family)